MGNRCNQLCWVNSFSTLRSGDGSPDYQRFATLENHVLHVVGGELYRCTGRMVCGQIVACAGAACVGGAAGVTGVGIHRTIAPFRPAANNDRHKYRHGHYGGNNHACQSFLIQISFFRMAWSKHVSMSQPSHFAAIRTNMVIRSLFACLCCQSRFLCRPFDSLLILESKETLDA